MIEDIAQTSLESQCLSEMPDKFIADRIKPRSADGSYSPMLVQRTFDGAFNNAELLRDRMFAIKPETDFKISMLYLKDASYALFMSRAKQGILNSESKDLIPFFQKLLVSQPDERTESKLEGILDEIRGAPMEAGTTALRANRFKAAFCLLQAANAQRRENAH